MNERLVSGLVGVFMATLVYPFLMRLLSRKSVQVVDRRAMLVCCLGAGTVAVVTQWLMFSFQK